MFLKLAAGKKEYLGTKSWELQSYFLIFISSWTCFRCVSKYPWLLWRIEILNIDVTKTIGNVWYCEKISRWVWFKSTYHPQWLNKAPTPSLQLYTVLRIKAIYLRSLGLVTAVNSKDNIFKWCVEQGQRCYNQTLLFVQIHLFENIKSMIWWTYENRNFAMEINMVGS